MATILLAPPLDAQSNRPPGERFPADFDRYVADVLTRRQIPGIGVAVVRNDSVLVAKGYGVRHVNER